MANIAKKMKRWEPLKEEHDEMPRSSPENDAGTQTSVVSDENRKISHENRKISNENRKISNEPKSLYPADSAGDKSGNGEKGRKPLRRSDTNITDFVCPSYVNENKDDEMLSKPSHYDITLRYQQEERHMSTKNDLFRLKGNLVDAQFVLMIIGYILMIIENELYINDVYTKASIPSIVVKSFISISTLALLILLVIYAFVGMKIKAFGRNLNDWRSVLTNREIILIIMQFLMCLIHPIPGDIKTIYISVNKNRREVSIDAVLSILMVGRLFLVGRLIIHRSFFISDITTRTLCVLNKIEYEAKFIFKAMVSSYPMEIIFGSMIANLIACSYSMHVCESYYNPDINTGEILESMWIVADGNDSPHCYCGRVVMITYNFVQLCTSSLLIAVISSKLDLSRAERYVSNYSMREKLVRQCNNAGAEVVKLMAHIWRSKTIKKHMKMVPKHQRRLYYWFRQQRQSKMDIREIDDTNVGLVDLHYSVNAIEENLREMHSEHRNLNTRIESIHTMLQNQFGIQTSDTEIQTELQIQD